MDKIETLPPPPGVIGSLKAGFDAISANLSVILLPLGLDLLLWLGPRLRVERLLMSVFHEVAQIYEALGILPADLETSQESSALLLEQLQQINLLSALRTFPIGVFSLMSGPSPGKTPWGSPQIFHVESEFTLLGWIALLTVAGWIFGGLFFRRVSLVVKDSSEVNSLGQIVLQTFFLSVMFFVLAFMLGIPMLIVLLLILSVSPVLAQGLLLIVGLFSMWLIVPVFFTPHGIFMRQQNAFSSVYSSLRMARFTLPTSSLFVLSVLLIGFGMNYLWAIPSPDTWMALVGVAGHAFITTSLLAASFIYYRDMQVWLQTVLEKLKNNLPAQQA